MSSESDCLDDSLILTSEESQKHVTPLPISQAVEKALCEEHDETIEYYDGLDDPISLIGFERPYFPMRALSAAYSYALIAVNPPNFIASNTWLNLCVVSFATCVSLAMFWAVISMIVAASGCYPIALTSKPLRRVIQSSLGFIGLYIFGSLAGFRSSSDQLTVYTGLLCASAIGGTLIAEKVIRDRRTRASTRVDSR